MQQSIQNSWKHLPNFYSKTIPLMSCQHNVTCDCQGRALFLPEHGFYVTGEQCNVVLCDCKLSTSSNTFLFFNTTTWQPQEDMFDTVIPQEDRCSDAFQKIKIKLFQFNFTCVDNLIENRGSFPNQGQNNFYQKITLYDRNDYFLFDGKYLKFKPLSHWNFLVPRSLSALSVEIIDGMYYIVCFMETKEDFMQRYDHYWELQNKGITKLQENVVSKGSLCVIQAYAKGDSKKLVPLSLHEIKSYPAFPPQVFSVATFAKQDEIIILAGAANGSFIDVFSFNIKKESHATTLDLFYNAYFMFV